MKKINFEIELDDKTVSKFKEYLERFKSENKNIVCKRAIEDFLTSAIDDSFEGWNAYLRSEEGIEPEEAEKQAYLNHLGGQFVPLITYSRDKLPF